MTETCKNSLKPAQFLVDNIALLPKGTVLDLAMGFGRNALYLAKMGFSVEGIDIEYEAVRSALEIARKSGVKLRAEVADLENDYTIKKQSFDAIVCFNYLHRPLFPEIKEGLRSGGMVIYETFIVDQTRFGKPKNPDYLLEHNELLKMFRDFRCLRYREGMIENRKAVASIVAEKL